MLLFALACSLLAAQAPNASSVLLQDGVELRVRDAQPYKYWNCSDTFLAKGDKEGNYGAEPVLECGPESRALIRFTDLRRAIGPAKRITGAKLILTSAGGSAPREIRLHRVLADWHEGYGRRRSKTGTKSPWSATWDFRFSPSALSGERWAGAGCAAGGKDLVERASAIARPSPGIATYELAGLEADVQGWYDREYTNYGWVIVVQEAGVQFASSEAAVGRPALEISFTDTEEPARGPDLTVAYIERLPEFKRYDPTNAYTQKEDRGTRVGIMDKPGFASDPKWPADGSLVTYRGHVRNQALEGAVNGFRYTWSINGKEVRSGEHTGAVQPGETVLLEIPAIWVNDHSDHRIRTVALQVETTTPEVTQNNNRLSIYSHGLNFGIWCEKSVADYLASKLNGLGSYSFEDWIQWQFSLWNEVYMPNSKFSFALDGCLERVRIQRITVVPDGTLSGGNHIPGGKTDFNYDGEWGFEWSEDDPDNVRRYCDYIRTNIDGALIHECSHQIGLMDIYVMNIDASLPNGERGKVRLKAGGEHVITRGNIDPYGGLMGGGDTRNDTVVPGFLAIRNEPVRDSRLEFRLFEPTGLYAALDVGGLNSNLGYRRGFYGEFLYDLPPLVFLRALDGGGKPVPNAELSFYQLNGGQFKDEPPVFEGVTDETGVFRLPNRPTGEQREFKTLTGHVLRPNPFGRIDVVGGNGVFLIRIRYEGQEEWQLLKLWEMVTAYYRGAESVLIKDVHFTLCPRALEPEDLAAGRPVTVSWASTEAPRVLTDGDPKTVYPFPATPNASVTIDLGAEHDVGEVTLHAYGRHGDFWGKFDLYVLSNTGPEGAAAAFAAEENWQWSIGHKRDVDPNDHEWWRLAYRGEPVRGRYVRIVNRSERGGQLAEITVRAAAPAKKD